MSELKGNELLKVVERGIALSQFLNREAHHCDIDSQIKAVEMMRDSFANVPVYHAIISSLKELRAIKRKQNAAG